LGLKSDGRRKAQARFDRTVADLASFFMKSKADCEAFDVDSVLVTRLPTRSQDIAWGAGANYSTMTNRWHVVIG
jgi:hypothetical protein